MAKKKKVTKKKKPAKQIKAFFKEGFLKEGILLPFKKIEYLTFNDDEIWIQMSIDKCFKIALDNESKKELEHYLNWLTE